ncbi:MAG: hypothetical protein QXJ21_09585 [Thermofilum sp.]
MSKERERLLRAFFAQRTVRGKLCNYPGHGYHHRDLVEGGRWYYHGHPIASLQVVPGSAPRLWISHAGYPTVSTFSRLRVVLDEWKKRVGIPDQVILIIRRFLGRKYMEYTAFFGVFELGGGRAAWYMFPREGLTLVPHPGSVEVLVGEGETPAEEVLPPWYSADVVLPHVGSFTWRGGRLFFMRWGGKSEGQPYVEIRSAEDLRRELEKVRRTKVTKLLEAAASSGLEGVMVVLELLGKW